MKLGQSRLAVLLLTLMLNAASASAAIVYTENFDTDGDGTLDNFLDETALHVNDFDCGAQVGLCGFHTQGEPTSVFFAEFVPEPGTLAILGLGLGLVGMRARFARRKS